MGPQVRARMLEDLRGLFDLIPCRTNRLTVGEWAEKNRIIPQGLSPKPGPFKWSVTPYLREIADCLSESSDVREIAVMKGARIGFTVGVIENHLGYIIDVAPGPILFVSASQSVAETSIELRVDAMIQSAGLGDRIKSQVEKKHNKKTGDTKAKKEFAGGYLLAIGPNEGAKLRSFTAQYLHLDEIDAYRAQVGAKDKKKGVKKNEGDPIALAVKRTSDFSLTRKIVYGSTPLEDATSQIKALFEFGDQRYYYVPCKHCGHMQRLRWKDDKGEYRLKFERDEDGRLIRDSVHYECAKCGRPWTNADKDWFLPRGEWRPSTRARKEWLRSYHVSALYAPKDMFGWADICQEWIDAQDDTSRLRIFVNTVLGETWIEYGEAPRTDKVVARINQNEYPRGSLPASAKPLLVTVGVDVHPDRLECDIVAWGEGAESWSIDYRTIKVEPEGTTTAEPENPCWAKLHDLISSEHAGHIVNQVLIDCGYNTSIVYQFCANSEYERGHVMPVKGDPGLAKDKSAKTVLKFQPVDEYGIEAAHINADHFKGEIYSCINRGTPDGKVPSVPFPGFCHFPGDYERRYAQMLTAERVQYNVNVAGRTERQWVQQGRNEALDCRVYALAALYVLMKREAMAWAEFYRKQQIENPPAYTWPIFWQEVGAEAMKKTLDVK